MISRTIDIVSKAANALAMLMLLGMFLHIALEMVLRNVFNTSTFVLDEFVGYAVSALIFMGLGETFRRGELIQVALLRDRLSERGRLALDLFGHAAAAVVGGMIVAFVGFSSLRQFERGTTSSSIAQVPLWIPEFMVFLGSAIFLLRVVQSACEMLATGKPKDSEA